MASLRHTVVTRQRDSRADLRRKEKHFLVEVINLRVRAKSTPVKLHQAYSESKS